MKLKQTADIKRVKAMLECCLQLYSHGHVKLLAAELSDLDVFARVLKVNDKRFVFKL